MQLTDRTREESATIGGAPDPSVLLCRLPVMCKRLSTAHVEKEDILRMKSRVSGSFVAFLPADLPGMRHLSAWDVVVKNTKQATGDNGGMFRESARERDRCRSGWRRRWMRLAYLAACSSTLSALCLAHEVRFRKDQASAFGRAPWLGHLFRLT